MTMALLPLSLPDVKVLSVGDCHVVERQKFVDRLSNKSITLLGSAHRH